MDAEAGRHGRGRRDHAAARASSPSGWSPADPRADGRAAGQHGLVVLDTEVTPSWRREGLARDVVRLVQQARRDAGLAVSDRIALTLELPGDG